MIPRIIHQTWREPVIPAEMGDQASWTHHNPDWDYRFWTDEDLERFMSEYFPEPMALYRSYPHAVQRTDLARYCLLYVHGGLYADADTRCLASLEPIVAEERVILCEEPSRNRWQAQARGLDRLYFNGTMASPPGHPFWKYVMDLCVKTRRAAKKDVLESTGPLVLSAAIEQWPRQDDLSLHSSHLFAPDPEEEDPRHGAIRETLSEHLWAGSWFRKGKARRSRDLVGHLRRLRHLATRGDTLSEAELRAAIDEQELHAPLTDVAHPPVAVFIPVRNGGETLEQNFHQLLALDYPLDKIKLVYCEGDSTDDSVAVIRSLLSEHGSRFRETLLIHHSTGQTLPRAGRWHPKYQRGRRAAIAAVRNAMIRHALSGDDEWVLWIDCDIASFEPDTLSRLLAAKRKIVVPDCVLEKDGSSFDLNTFLVVPGASLRQRYKHMRHGIAQPPADVWYRRHLHDLRYLDKVEVDSVGGTMLLVHASVHRAGLSFPEKPYKDLIETEAFGAVARDLGIPALALPNVQILHVPF